MVINTVTTLLELATAVTTPTFGERVFKVVMWTMYFICLLAFIYDLLAYNGLVRPMSYYLLRPTRYYFFSARQNQDYRRRLLALPRNEEMAETDVGTDTETVGTDTDLETVGTNETNIETDEERIVEMEEVE